MGVFYEQSVVVNRTSKKLHCRFDGQDIELEPNYTPEGELIPDVVNMIPTIAVPYAKSQNVRMGSEDPLDPSSFEVLVGVKAKKGQKQIDAIDFLEQSEDLTRVPLDEYLDDPNAKIVLSGRRMPRNGEARLERDTTPFEPRVRS